MQCVCVCARACVCAHGKNSFIEKFKILAGYRLKKKIMLNYQNNYIFIVQLQLFWLSN